MFQRSIESDRGTPGSKIISAKLREAVLAELSEDEREVQLEAVSAFVRSVEQRIAQGFLAVGQVLFECVYGGDASKVSDKGNRGEGSIRAVAARCNDGDFDHVESIRSESGLRRCLNAYLAVKDLELDPAAAAKLGAVRLQSIRTASKDVQQIVARALANDDFPAAKAAVDAARKVKRTESAVTSPPPMEDLELVAAGPAQGQVLAIPSRTSADDLDAAQTKAKAALVKAIATAVDAGVPYLWALGQLDKAWPDDVAVRVEVAS